MADTAIIGRLGTLPLAGLALASVVMGTLTFLCFFLTTGTTARVAFLSGRGAHRSAAEVVPQALWVAAALGISLAALVVVAARPLAELVGGEPAVIDEAVTYLRISGLAIPMVLVAFVGNGWHRGRSDTRTPLTIVVVANVLNVGLDLFLVYGLDLGLAGAAIGTVIAQSVAGVWFATLLVRAIVRHEAGVRPHRTELVRILRVARQVGLRTAALLATLALATAVASRISAESLAGHQIAFQMFLFLALSVDALAVAAQALVGTSLGRGGVEEARAVGRRGVRMGVVVGAVLPGVVLVTSPLIPRLFTGDASVIDRASVALVGLAVLQIPAAVAFTLDGVPADLVLDDWTPGPDSTTRLLFRSGGGAWEAVSTRAGDGPLGVAPPTPLGPAASGFTVIDRAAAGRGTSRRPCPPTCSSTDVLLVQDPADGSLHLE
ncbi:MAG: MATE family efflux transporter, partial [Actinobacteria bacterium]|nr:MATE family efflux transporter [Actinomycetota bacterium]